ncbi:hypothetical protein WICPIJ_002249 [Wickerhamomyces pijperi]|uniref:Uncharacterized protein n=1 Tax=Wickerhamomyces pijperi TaxID=599730 RepID=A0A9P8QC40_WICPI|nr:hypothetical protein WICPIJ_002249 [Wickerhamomyces pijperi]
MVSGKTSESCSKIRITERWSTKGSLEISKFLYLCGTPSRSEPSVAETIPSKLVSESGVSVDSLSSSPLSSPSSSSSSS